MPKQMESGEVSAFFEGMSMMFSAGIQLDEASALMGENLKPGPFKNACDVVHGRLLNGDSLYQAASAAGAFPAHALTMLRAGCDSGRIEETMRSLAVYYSEDSRLAAKVRGSVVYPVALLGVMTVILAFIVAVILPVFFDVYRSLSGDVATGAFSYVSVSVAVGWIAFAFIALCTVLALLLAAANATPRGRDRVVRLFARLPFTRTAMYCHAVSRFTSVLATYVSAGFDANEAMRRAVASVENRELRRKVDAACALMSNPSQAKSLAQAFSSTDVFDPVYARMLAVGLRSGTEDRVLERLADVYFEDAVALMDDLVEGVEPLLAAVLTVGVGAALIAVMLPLVGIMGSIG